MTPWWLVVVNGEFHSILPAEGSRDEFMLEWGASYQVAVREFETESEARAAALLLEWETDDGRSYS